ncbi:MAG: metallophosphoesterase, partial [Sedimenticola sp.]
EMLLDKLNAYSADIVINTGDSTTDALESEFEAARDFLNSIKCEHIISIVGNHDKRNMRSQDFFQKYINKVDLIHPKNPEKCTKNRLFLDGITSGVKDRFTDINFIKKISVNGESGLVVCLDTNELYKDNGNVDEEVLEAVSSEITRLNCDQVILLNHHSILETDSDPLFNSSLVIDLIKKHNIQHVFCGHTHKMAIMKTIDLYHQYSFTQYKNGTLTSHSHPSDTNMFMFYENIGKKEMKINLIRIYIEGDQLIFKEEVIASENG